MTLPSSLQGGLLQPTAVTLAAAVQYNGALYCSGNSGHYGYLSFVIHYTNMALSIANYLAQ
jgi:hypothetical protein